LREINERINNQNLHSRKTVEPGNARQGAASQPPRRQRDGLNGLRAWRILHRVYVPTLRQVFRGRATAVVNLSPPKDGLTLHGTPLIPGLLVTRQQVAAWLGINAKTLQRWVSDGKIPKPINMNGQLRWRSETLIEWAIFCQSVGGHEGTPPDVQGTTDETARIPTRRKDKAD
jgi:predicted DNA-binding transcriptional regulator AlpA